MSQRSVVILGGGLAGMAAAYTLLDAGAEDVAIVERDEVLGGLAGAFERDGHEYPLAYHHILHQDRPLHFFLDRIGVLDRVRWTRIPMLFEQGSELYDFTNPIDFLRFPMSPLDKARFVRLMLRCFLKQDWEGWHGRSAAELVDSWGGPGVRHALFESLCRIKFDLSCAETSGAWLGARLNAREGSAPLGYVPGTNWTSLLCTGLARLLEERGARLRLRTSVSRLRAEGERVVAVELEGGETLPADDVISTVPVEKYLPMLPEERTPGLPSVRYTAIVSVIMATRQQLERDFYWMNLTSLEHNANGIFRLERLNPTIGVPGDSYLNFITHLPSRAHDFFRHTDEELIAGYLEDFRDIFGFALEPHWTRISRIPLYSPVLARGYQNPPVRSTSWPNVFFAGNYRTFPSVVSTGTALASGVEAADAILEDAGVPTQMLGDARQFRLPSMPRA